MRSIIRALHDINLPFYIELLQEYGLDNVARVREMGKEQFGKELLELGVDQEHIPRISDEVFYTSYVNVQEMQDEKQESRIAEAVVDGDSVALIEWDDERVHEWFVTMANENEVFHKCMKHMEKHGNMLNGKQLLLVLQSNREMQEVLGLDSIEERVYFESKVNEINKFSGSGTSNVDQAEITGTFGTLYNPEFLRAIQPLWSFHMGCENMGPMLYNIVRFTKASKILEIGAGYTSAFLLQAIKDNVTEIDLGCKMQRNGFMLDGTTPYFCEALEESETVKRIRNGVLHCVDNMAHAETTAHKLQRVAAVLGVSEYLKLHVADGFKFYMDLEAENEIIDLMWVDFGAGSKLDLFFENNWSLLNPQGGLIVVHSTLTNRFTRRWLEQMRTRGTPSFQDGLAQWDPVLGEFATLSFFEPHKMFQNSFSIFQRRSNDYSEPLYTNYP